MGCRQNRAIPYYVLWKKFSDLQATFKTFVDVKNASVIVAAYRHRSHARRISCSVGAALGCFRHCQENRTKFHGEVSVDGGKQDVPSRLRLNIFKSGFESISRLLLIPNVKKIRFRVCYDLRMLNSVTIKNGNHQ